MARYRRLIAIVGFIPLVIVAVAAPGPEDKEPKPRARAEAVDLLSPRATLRDFRNASEAQKERFLAHFTRLRLGEAEPVAMTELWRHLNSKLTTLPAGGDSMELLKAAAGRTSLWEAAEYAAENLGWPQR